MEMKKLFSSPNQKIIRVVKNTSDEKGEFVIYNRKDQERAAILLDAGAFKLWCYMARNKNDFTFALSQVDCEEHFGMKVKQYRAAVNELIKVGYLKRIERNLFWFYSSLENIYS